MRQHSLLAFQSRVPFSSYNNFAYSILPSRVSISMPSFSARSKWKYLFIWKRPVSSGSKCPCNTVPSSVICVNPLSQNAMRFITGGNCAKIASYELLLSNSVDILLFTSSRNTGEFWASYNSTDGTHAIAVAENNISKGKIVIQLAGNAGESSHEVLVATSSIGISRCGIWIASGFGGRLSHRCVFTEIIVNQTATITNNVISMSFMYLILSTILQLLLQVFCRLLFRLHCCNYKA